VLTDFILKHRKTFHLFYRSSLPSHLKIPLIQLSSDKPSPRPQTRHPSCPAEMKTIKSELRFCPSCMGEHVVGIVEVIEREIFKDIEVEFPAIYEYCSNTDEYKHLLRTSFPARKISLSKCSFCKMKGQFKNVIGI